MKQIECLRVHRGSYEIHGHGRYKPLLHSFKLLRRQRGGAKHEKVKSFKHMDLILTISNFFRSSTFGPLLRTSLLVAGLLTTGGLPSHAQNTSSSSAPSVSTSATNLYHPIYSIPIALQRQYVAMGDRLQKPGQERVTMTGTLMDSSGSTSAQIITELGGKVSIVWMGPTPKTLIFNGMAASATAATTYDSDLLSAFVDDLAESLFLSMSQGTGFRLLGQRFNEGDGTFCDFYDVPMPGKTNKQPPQFKRYCFDSTAGFLRFVQYSSTAAVSAPAAQTSFTGWHLVNGQAVPGQVTRLEGGKQVFSFQVLTAAVAPTAADATFALTH